MIPKDGQAFLQCELEPVATSDAIARPIVKIFVSNHSFDAFKVRVGGRLSIRQYVCRVEYIQTLVLHGPHIEIIYRHDIE